MDEPAALSCAVRLQAVATASALLRRGVRGRRHPGGDRHRALVRGGARASDSARAAACARPERRLGRRAAGRRQARLLRRPRHRHADRPPAARRARRARRDRAAAGLRDGRHVGRRVRRRDAVLLLDLCRGRLAARGTARGAPGVAGHRLRPGAHRPGHRVRLLRGAGRRRAAPPGPQRDHGQLEPARRSRPTSTRRRGCTSSRSTRRACIEVLAPRASTATTPDALIQFGGQTPLGLAGPLAEAGIHAARPGSRRHRPDRGAHALRRARRPTGHPAARGRHGVVASRRRSWSPSASATR